MANGPGGIYLNTESGLNSVFDQLAKGIVDRRTGRAASAYADAVLGPDPNADDQSSIFDRLAKNFGLSNVGTGADYRKQNQPQSQGDQNSQSPALLPSPRAPQTPMAYNTNDGLNAIDRASPRGIRNNNPGNIEDGNFARSIPGYAGSDGRFARFDSPEGGFQAQSRLLDTYANKYGLNTVAGIVGRWAPANDGNNVSAYAGSVARQMGVDPNQPLDISNPQVKASLIGAMIQHENGRNPYDQQRITSAISGGGQTQPVQARLPPTQYGGPTAYTSTGQPVATDASGNAIQTVPAPQAPAAGPQVPASPFGTLNAPQSAPDWKGMPAPAMAYAPQQQPSPAQAAPRQIPAQPVPTQQPAAPQPQPYQVAQAGGGFPQAQQQPVSPFTPQEAAALRIMIKDPGTMAKALEIIQSRTEPKNPMIVPEGASLYDQRTRTFSQPNGQKMTDQQRNYNFYSQQEQAAGRAPQSFNDWQIGQRKAGATNVNVDTKGDNKFAETAATSIAKRFEGIIAEGDTAQGDVALLGQLDELGKMIGTGAGAAAQKWLADRGVKVGENVGAVEAYGAIIDKLTPAQRIPGSGATSDYDARMFKGSLPSLMNTPQGNAILSETLQSLAQSKINRAVIAERALNREITPGEAVKQLRALPDPMARFREARKNNPELFSRSAQKPVSASPPAAPVRITSPADAANLPKGTRIIIPKFDSATGKVIGEEVGVVP